MECALSNFAFQKTNTSLIMPAFQLLNVGLTETVSASKLWLQPSIFLRTTKLALRTMRPLLSYLPNQDGEAHINLREAHTLSLTK